MALGYTVVRQGVDHSAKRYVEADVTFDNSYPTGGEAVDLALVGLSRIERVELVYVVTPDKAATAGTNHGRQVVPVVTNVYAPLLKVFTANVTEAGNATDQSQIVQRIRFVGA